MTSPIPRRLLPHSVTYKKFVSNDARGKPTFQTDVSVSCVRCENVKKTGLNAQGESKDDLLVLFYDCINSIPTGIVPAKFDAFVFNGQQYTVREVTPEWAVYGVPHHYEVALK